MASIIARKRQDGSIVSYVAQIIKRTPKHHESKAFKSPQAAKKWAEKREKEINKAIEAGLPIVKQSVASNTLAFAIKKYVDGTYKEIGRTKAQVLRTIADPESGFDITKMRCHDIQKDHIIQFAEQVRARPASASTALNYLSHLSAVFDVGSESYGLPFDMNAMNSAIRQCNRRGITGKSNSRDVRPTLDQLNALMDFFAKKVEYRPSSLPMHRVVAFALFSTRRQEEITRIQWQDYDSKNGRIIVRDMKHPGDKKGNHTLVELPDPASAIINAMPKVSEFIFPFTTDAISANFTRACKALLIDDLRFHDLRHEGASRLFEMGKTIPQVASVTGHRSWISLKRYTNMIYHPGDRYAGWEWIEKVT